MRICLLLPQASLSNRACLTQIRTYYSFFPLENESPLMILTVLLQL